MKRKFLILAALLSLTLSQTTYAANYQTEVTNNIGIGDISISLAEYELDAEGNEIPYEDGKVILPGQKVDKIVRITNNANTAWIRAKLEYKSEDGLALLDDKMVTISSSDWIKVGDYYYYKIPVAKEAAVDFIDEVRMPTEWTEDDSGKAFSIIVTADAVQTDNFNPDFESADPWFGTVIETCVHTEYSREDVAEENFSVEYQGGAEGLVRVGEDFFSNWGELMPGDTVSDTVMIKNGYHRPISIYFSTETIADDALLKALELEIKSGEKIIYKGTLDGEVKDSVRIAYLIKDEESALTYTLHVPEWLNNEYALSKTKTKWKFTCEIKSSHGGGGGGGSSSGGGTKGTPGIGPGTPETPAEPGVLDTLIDTLPKTGDDAMLFGAFGLLVVTGLGTIFLGKKKKKEESEVAK